MTFEMMLAGFIMAVGLCIAASGTYLYQGVFNTPAMLRYDGRSYLHSVGHLFMSFVCGPFIMLQLGWRQEDDGTVTVTSVLISALVAFGWAFVVGLLFLGVVMLAPMPSLFG